MSGEQKSPSRALHEVRFVIEPGGVSCDWLCHAEPGASCRMTCPERCESWGADHAHTLVDNGSCLVLDWLENDAWDERYNGDPAPLRSGPIEVEWVDEGYDWHYSDPVQSEHDAADPS